MARVLFYIFKNYQKKILRLGIYSLSLSLSSSWSIGLFSIFHLSLEENPKWDIISEILDEIRAEIKAYAPEGEKMEKVLVVSKVKFITSRP